MGAAAAFLEDLLHVLGVVDVELLCRMVLFPWWLIIVSADWRRLLRSRGGGSNIRRCVRSDQCVDVEGGDGEGYGGW